MARETPEIDGRTESAAAGLSAAVALIAGRCFPLKAGEIQLDAQGRIQARNEAMPLRFGFAYRGIEYDAAVETAPGPQAGQQIGPQMVRLTAELGKMPYTMEIGEGRRLIRRILCESTRAPHGGIGLGERDDMRLEAVSTPPEPFTPASLMATLTALLLEFQPYLDLLARVLDDARCEKTLGTPAPETP